VLDRFNMSLGAGLGRLKGRVFRIGHLGDFNELMLLGTLGGVELGLAAAGVPYTPGGVQAAIEDLQSPVKTAARLARNAATPSRKSWLA
jgi:alanine-glyoxylate transaminase/serine-glyoxylate transaminase/serine-pyruvate transaminase